MEDKLQKSKEIFDGFCEYLKSNDCRFNKDDENLVVFFIIKSDNIEIKFIAKAEVNRETLRIMAMLPVNFGSGKRIDGAMVTTIATSGMANGSFDYDISSGNVMFKISQSFVGSKISPAVYDYMVDCAMMTIAEYFGKFLAVSEGKMTVPQFMKS